MEQNIIQKEIFGSFYLNGSEFAISVSRVQEVVNPPTRYASIPLAPTYLIGLFNLRGTIIPVIDLKNLLQLKNIEESNEQKIAILELSGHCVGILFDKTGEIFKSDAEERSDFNDTEYSIIQGVFKKDNGKRLLQILDVERIFKLEALPKPAISSTKHIHKKGLRKQCISFIVGPAKCALGIHEIQEILKVDKVDDSALAIKNCIGTIDLRGFTVPVIDFSALLGYRVTDTSETATTGDRRIMVMRIGEELFGFLVDAVDSIVSFYQEDLKQFLAINHKRTEMFTGCLSLEGQNDILLLDHQKILSNTEILEITHGHSKLYNTKTQAKVHRQQENSSRRTFITFVVDNVYAIQINEVKEIIEYPKGLLQPPGLPTHCRGVLNLRGDMVMIVDARHLYGKLETTSLSSSKVLIFKKTDMHFGLIVDSVEEIITFSDKDKMKLPDILYREESPGLTQDVMEAIHYKDNLSQQTKNMLIMNTDSMVERIRSAL